MLTVADPGDGAVLGVGLGPLVFEFDLPLGHGCWSLVLFVSRAGSGLCDELTTRSEKSYRTRARLCVSV